MTNTHTEPVIIGIVARGTRVTITHDGHPHNGETVIVTGANGATGGIAGGGCVSAMSATDTRSFKISRYTRVTVH